LPGKIAISAILYSIKANKSGGSRRRFFGSGQNQYISFKEDIPEILPDRIGVVRPRKVVVRAIDNFTSTKAVKDNSVTKRVCKDITTLPG